MRVEQLAFEGEPKAVATVRRESDEDAAFDVQLSRHKRALPFCKYFKSLAADVATFENRHSSDVAAPIQRRCDG
jgi:hypothetical protein